MMLVQSVKNINMMLWRNLMMTIVSCMLPCTTVQRLYFTLTWIRDLDNSRVIQRKYLMKENISGGIRKYFSLCTSVERECDTLVLGSRI